METTWRAPDVRTARRLAFALLILMLAVALTAGTLIVGGRLLTSTRTDDRLKAAYPIPQGGAAVLVFDTFENVPGGRPNGEIFTVRADGTDLRQLTSGPDVESSPSWSPDGLWIAYHVVHDGTQSVAVMDGGGGNRTTLFTSSQPGQDCIGGGLEWSPDGATLLVPISTACDDQFDLFFVATDGSTPATRLVGPEVKGSFPAWSPDGGGIVFVGSETAGDNALYVVDAGVCCTPSGRATRITRGVDYDDWGPPRWSPDGTQLAAASGSDDGCARPGTMDAWVMDGDGSNKHSLAIEAAKEYNPTWSPDGARLAFQRIVDRAEWVNSRPCTMATWVIDGDGTNERRLDGLGTDNAQPPFWSPDGTRIVGNTVDVIDGVEHYDMFVVTVDGSSPMVTVDDVGIASWQPLAAPLPSAPSFPASS